MLNIKLEKKSYKMSFKELLVKIQWLANQRVRVGGGGAQGLTHHAFFLNDILYQIYSNSKPKIEFWKLRNLTEIFSLNQSFPIDSLQHILRNIKNKHLFRTKQSVFCSEKGSSLYWMNDILFRRANYVA